MESNLKELFAKIFDVRSEISGIAKDKVNPFFKSNYFNIDSVIDGLDPILLKHRLDVYQPLSELNGNPAIETLIVDPDSGQSLSRVTPLIQNSDVQKYGGTITYTRRFALTSFFRLKGEEDDDGNAVVKPIPKPTVKAPIKPVTPQKDQIATLVLGLGYNPETKAQWEAQVKALTDLDLVAKNYAEIIARLEVIKSERK